jgi:hypothetical protein
VLEVVSVRMPPQPVRSPQPSPLSGLDAVLGHVVVRINRSDAYFDVGGVPMTTPRELRVPGGTVGRGDSTVGRGDNVTIALVGPDAARVSRRHLLICPVGHTWTVVDLESKNHTYELVDDLESGETERVKLVPGQAIPIHSGMVLSLGERLYLSLTLAVPPLSGNTTPDDGPPRRARDVRITPNALETFAFVLLARRRADARDHSVPTLAELEATIFVSQATLYRRLTALRALPRVAGLLGAGESWSDVAEATAIAYPYLLFPAASSLD